MLHLLLDIQVKVRCNVTTSYVTDKLVLQLMFSLTLWGLQKVYQSQGLSTFWGLLFFLIKPVSYLSW